MQLTTRCGDMHIFRSEFFALLQDNCTDGDLQCWSKFRAKTKKLTKNQLKKAGEKFLKTYALDLGGRDIKFVLEMSHDTKVR